MGFFPNRTTKGGHPGNLASVFAAGAGANEDADGQDESAQKIKLVAAILAALFGVKMSMPITPEQVVGKFTELMGPVGDWIDGLFVLDDVAEAMGEASVQFVKWKARMAQVKALTPWLVNATGKLRAYSELMSQVM